MYVNWNAALNRCHPRIKRIQVLAMGKCTSVLQSLFCFMLSDLAHGGVPPGNEVHGALFSDRILPMPIHKELRSDLWGAEGVVPRDPDNGIEHPDWSWWGGRPMKDTDGKYHMLEGADIGVVADCFFDYLLDVAAGFKTRNEENAYRDFAIWKQGVTL